MLDMNSQVRLGLRLLEKCTQLVNLSSPKSDELVLLVELLVKAQNCFVRSCSMQGIEKTLQICEKCAFCLEKAGEFGLMVMFLLLFLCVFKYES